jgi:hypothetical protein
LALTVASVALSVIASGPSQYQTMCASGRYENVNQMIMKSRIALNFIALGERPMIRHGVIAAKVIWNAMNVISGIGTPFENVAARAVSRDSLQERFG